jgi:hypothetical protein
VKTGPSLSAGQAAFAIDVLNELVDDFFDGAHKRLERGLAVNEATVVRVRVNYISKPSAKRVGVMPLRPASGQQRARALRAFLHPRTGLCC